MPASSREKPNVICVKSFVPKEKNWASSAISPMAIDGSEAVDGLRVSEKDNGDLRVGDEIIWVEKADDSKTVYFIVVVSESRRRP